MNSNLASTLLWSLLAYLALLLALGFCYVYQKDRDKRKLMFTLAYVFAALSFLPKIQTEWENIQIMERLHNWGALPILLAVLIAGLSCLLKLKDFDKAFKTFLFILATSIFMIIVPLPVNPTLLFQGISIIVIAVSIYLYLTRREISDLMFLLSMVCFSSGGLAMGKDLELHFTVFAYVFAYVFIALVFVTSKEGVKGGIASFFALERELEKTQEELRISQEKLVKAEKLAAIGRAATMVGHDLRNPLQTIRNATYYLNIELPRLSSAPIPQKAVKMLQAIDNSVDYADKIVKDLKDFASTKQPLLARTDVNAIVKDALSQIKAPENVETITELSQLPWIEVDRDMIKRVFLNIVTNGIQAMEKGGTLKVSTKKTKKFVEVRFEDTGVGMPKENLEKLFSPFFTTKAQGMGMGLPICKKFVESHGGSIEVESQVGKGSTFTVKLPIQQENKRTHTFNTLMLQT